MSLRSNIRAARLTSQFSTSGGDWTGVDGVGVGGGRHGTRSSAPRHRSRMRSISKPRRRRARLASRPTHSGRRTRDRATARGAAPPQLSVASGRARSRTRRSARRATRATAPVLRLTSVDTRLKTSAVPAAPREGSDGPSGAAVQATITAGAEKTRRYSKLCGDAGSGSGGGRVHVRPRPRPAAEIPADVGSRHSPTMPKPSAV